MNHIAYAPMSRHAVGYFPPRCKYRKKELQARAKQNKRQRCWREPSHRFRIWPLVFEGPLISVVRWRWLFKLESVYYKSRFLSWSCLSTCYFARTDADCSVSLLGCERSTSPTTSRPRRMKALLGVIVCVWYPRTSFATLDSEEKERGGVSAPEPRRDPERHLGHVTLGNHYPHLTSGGYPASSPVAKQWIMQKAYVDRNCFLEGLFFRDNQTVVESCGLNKKSRLKTLIVASQNHNGVHTPLSLREIKVQKIEDDVFSEGVVDLKGKTYMLTYQQGKMWVFDKQTWQIETKLPFAFGQGWGLTTDGCTLFATTGDSFLYHIDAATGNLIKKVPVTDATTKKGIKNLNEVEFIAPRTIWVNIWLTNRVGRIFDLNLGVVDRYIDLKVHRWSGDSTPNGLAYNYEFGPLRLLAGGKLWDKIYVLELKSADELCGGAAPAGGSTSTAASPAVCPSAPRSACHETGKVLRFKADDIVGEVEEESVNKMENMVMEGKNSHSIVALGKSGHAHKTTTVAPKAEPAITAQPNRNPKPASSSAGTEASAKQANSSASQKPSAAAGSPFAQFCILVVIASLHVVVGRALRALWRGRHDRSSGRIRNTTSNGGKMEIPSSSAAME